MDTIEIKKHHTNGFVVDENITKVKRIINSAKVPKGSTAITDTRSVKTGREFLEFFINDVPLTDLLNKFYNQKGSVLDNSIGVLGGTTNLPAEIIKLKQLLGKKITDDDIRKVYPTSWTDNDFEYYLEKYRAELSDPEIIIYCCAQCGDYDCGGISVSIQKTDNSVIWSIAENGKTLNFEFNKYLYFDTFQNRIKYLENITR